jgi:hypothetical protein
VRLVYQEAFRSLGKALAREYAVKQLTRAQKDALIVGGRRPAIDLQSCGLKLYVPSQYQSEKSWLCVTSTLAWNCVNFPVPPENVHE